MWTPPSPEKEEVEEETCVEINVQDKKAIPFFTHDSGCIYIQGIFSTPFTITYYFITPLMNSLHFKKLSFFTYPCICI